MKNTIVKLLLLLFITPLVTYADEGMWLPQLLKQLNAPEMRIKGLEVSVDDIYSVNKNSMKDAVVSFGGGCTGEVISKSGLVLTNHHCGFDAIQKQSSLEHNYLKDGFWAKTLSDEIPCPGLTITFIIRIDDVTAEFNAVLTPTMTEQQRNDKIKELTAIIEKRSVEGTKYTAKVRQFFSGNDFYVIVSETFYDIRMVGAPPSSIGAFGGDTDNWAWPRHTGDFSIFRIYADADNKPAAYNSANKPFTPRYSFPISLKGVNQDEFTMVYGFPGRTQEYISSYGIELLMNVNNPNRVKVRDARLDIIKDAMRSNEKIHIQYAAKKSTIANAWKKWRGESMGLEHFDVINKKQTFEIDFQNWANGDAKRKEKYGAILPSLSSLHKNNRTYFHTNDYYAEAVQGIELVTYANSLKPLFDLYAVEKPDTSKIAEEKKLRIATTEAYFKNYDQPTDKKLMSDLLKIYDTNVADSLKPTYFTDMRTRYKNDFEKLAETLYKKSVFDEEKVMKEKIASLNASSAQKLMQDPGYLFSVELINYYKENILSKVTAANAEIGRLNRDYMQGQREMQPEKKFYPDANSTMRVAYGQVRGIEARDGVNYTTHTTIDGLIAKYIKGDEEFDAPEKLIELYKAKDYGRYTKGGTVPVAFLASNHTTGGNSGSPVLNGKGQLVGTNFDRLWEGVMSDLYYSPEICRNISLDIRYTLFIVEKLGNAKRLIDEMDIVD